MKVVKLAETTIPSELTELVNETMATAFKVVPDTPVLRAYIDRVASRPALVRAREKDAVWAAQQAAAASVAQARAAAVEPARHALTAATAADTARRPAQQSAAAQRHE